MPLLFLGLVAPLPVSAQPLVPPVVSTANLSGPRFGITSLGLGVVEALAERNIVIQPVMTQFGWQVERQFYNQGGSLAAVTEWVTLVGGLEQGVVLPSLTWLVGLRTRDGAEIGIGPNLAPTGVALAIAAGVTFRAGGLNIPMNVAIVPSSAGTRVSVLTGFTMRKRP